MNRYSCSYGGVKNNFTIIGLKDGKHVVKREFFSMFCVLQNIIQRGNPTNCSCYLEDKIGFSAKSAYSVKLISKQESNWSTVIKGDDRNADFPAADFFDIIIPEYFKNIPYIKSLIRPETPLSDILENGENFADQQVDFFVPDINTIIEIDGSSHEDDFQRFKDNERDRVLQREGYKVVRITAQEVKKRTTELYSKLHEIKRSIDELKITESYTVFEQNMSEKRNILVDSVMRIQILLIECLKNGMLSLDQKKWTINIVNSDIVNIEKVIRLAHSDLMIWLTNISSLLKLDMKAPELFFVQNYDDNDITIDFSIAERYTDDHVSKAETLYIRNCYINDRSYYKVQNSDRLTYVFSEQSEREDNNALNFLLKNLFGHDSFRDGQIEIIRNSLRGRDTIGILPTGTGKSLCYQIAALLQPGVSLVVVPIISLMMDQKKGLENIFINRAGYISSQITGAEKGKIIDDLKNGRIQFLFASPERFQNSEFREALVFVNKNLSFSTAVIDEVHCLSEWGHDFRVSYLTLVRTIKNYCPETRLLGLTATASQNVLEDIKCEFDVSGEDVKALISMERPELNFRRIWVERSNIKSPTERINEILEDAEAKMDIEDILADEGEQRHCGLVFSATVNSKPMNETRQYGCNKIYEKLSAQEKYKEKVATYHGKLRPDERKEVQNNFINNKYALLCCTKAFGMGIDKPNIRYTIHYGLPQSVEGFYQEAGRAGRDKSDAYCYIVYDKDHIDNKVIDEIFGRKTRPSRRKQLCERHLRGDLNSLMFLWNINRQDREAEFGYIRNILMDLYAGKREFYFADNSDITCSLSNIQNALYKLSILKIVKSWSVEYADLYHGMVYVEFNGVDDENVRNALLEYIRKYEADFTLEIGRKTDKTYVEILKGPKPVANYINYLIEWSNQNILLGRLQSTRNMMEWCDESVSDDEFRTNINYYFRFSEITICYDAIIAHPKDYSKWFEVFYEKDDNINGFRIISKKEAEHRLASLMRYLESYHFNTGLNFISALLRMFVNRCQNSDWKERMEDSLKDVLDMNEEDQEKILNETLAIAAKFDIENKDRLSEVVCEHYPDEIRNVYDIINDRYSLNCILKDATKRLQAGGLKLQ